MALHLQPARSHPKEAKETVMSLEQLDVDEETQQCIDNCLTAVQVTEHCADQCLDEDGDMTECIRLCRDVTEIASTHARLMARDSAYSGEIASVCADVCEACADECEQHDHDHCQACADALRDCVETCRQMAS